MRILVNKYFSFLLITFFLIDKIPLYSMENKVRADSLKKGKAKRNSIATVPPQRGILRLNSDPTSSMSKKMGKEAIEQLLERQKSLDGMQRSERSLNNLWGLYKYKSKETLPSAQNVAWLEARSSGKWSLPSSFEVSKNFIFDEGTVDNYYCKTKKVAERLIFAIDQQTIPFFTTPAFLEMKSTLNKHALYYCLEKIENEHAFILKLKNKEDFLIYEQKALILYEDEVSKLKKTTNYTDEKSKSNEILKLEKYKKEIYKIKQTVNVFNFTFASSLEKDIKKLVNLVDDKLEFCKKQKTKSEDDMAAYEKIFEFLCRAIEKKQKRFSTVLWMAIEKNYISWVKLIFMQLKNNMDLKVATEDLIRFALDNRDKWAKKMRIAERSSIISLEHIKYYEAAQNTSRDIVKFILNNVSEDLKRKILFESIKNNNLEHVTLLLEDHPGLVSLIDEETRNSSYIAALLNIKKRKKKQNDKYLVAQNIFSTIVKNMPLQNNPLYVHKNKKGKTIESLAAELKIDTIHELLNKIKEFERLKQQQDINLEKIDKAFTQAQLIIEKNNCTDFSALLDEIISLDEAMYISIFIKKELNEKNILDLILDKYFNLVKNNSYDESIKTFSIIQILIGHKKIRRSYNQFHINEKFTRSMSLLIDSLVEQAAIYIEKGDIKKFKVLLDQLPLLDVHENSSKYLPLFLKKTNEANHKTVLVQLLENYLYTETKNSSETSLLLFTMHPSIHVFYKKTFEQIESQLSTIISDTHCIPHKKCDERQKADAAQLQELTHKIQQDFANLPENNKSNFGAFVIDCLDFFNAMRLFSNEYPEYSFL